MSMCRHVISILVMVESMLDGVNKLVLQASPVWLVTSPSDVNKVENWTGQWSSGKGMAWGYADWEHITNLILPLTQSVVFEIGKMSSYSIEFRTCWPNGVRPANSRGEILRYPKKR